MEWNSTCNLKLLSLCDCHAYMTLTSLLHDNLALMPKPYLGCVPNTVFILILHVVSCSIIICDVIGSIEGEFAGYK